MLVAPCEEYEADHETEQQQAERFLVYFSGLLNDLEARICGS